MDTTITTKVIVFLAAHAIIMSIALWAALSPRVNDGLFGKLSLAFIAFSSIACIGWAFILPETVDRAETVFSAAIACMAIRCYCLKTYAHHLRRAIKRKVRQCRHN